MNVIQFPLVNSLNQPLTGALATLRAYTSISGSSTFPVQVFSDANGTASFSNVLPNVYSLTWTNSGANNPSTYVAHESDIVYLNIPVVTGTVNGFSYLTNSLPTSSFNSSSIVIGTETQLKSDIASLCNYFNRIINDWAVQEKGACFVVEDAEEKINIGFNNCIGPRCLLRFISQNPYGDSSISDVNGRVIRNFELIINRGKLLTDPRNSSLSNNVGPAKSFYSLLTGVFDTIRTIIPPSYCYPIVIMGDIRQDGSAEWLMDCYVISFSVICEIGRVQYNPYQLGGIGPFTDLATPAQWSDNTSPIGL